MLTVLNGFSRFVYLCVSLQRVLFNNAGCGTRCKSGRSPGPRRFSVSRNFHLGGRAASAPRGCGPGTGTRSLLLRGAPYGLCAGVFLPGLGLAHPPGKAKQKAVPGGGRASPRVHRLGPSLAIAPLPAMQPGSERGSRCSLTAPTRRALPCPAVPSRTGALPAAAPLAGGSFPPRGVPGAVSPPRRAPAATDGASARMETDSFCK